MEQGKKSVKNKAERGQGRERKRGREEERREQKKWDGMLDYLPPGRSGSLQNY